MTLNYKTLRAVLPLVSPCHFLFIFVFLTFQADPYTMNLKVDGCLSKNNLFGKSSLLMNTLYIVVP